MEMNKFQVIIFLSLVSLIIQVKKENSTQQKFQAKIQITFFFLNCSIDIFVFHFYNSVLKIYIFCHH